MNGAPGTYRRFTKELLQQNSQQEPIGNSNLTQSESESGYHSSSSAEPLSKPEAIHSTKRTLQIYQFAPESYEVNVNFTELQSWPKLSSKFHLNVHSNRLSRLRVDATSKFVPSFNQNPPKSKSQCLESTVTALSNSTKQTVPDIANNEVYQERFQENCNHEGFTSATSSPSHTHEVISESGTVSTDDPKNDNFCSNSDSSVVERIDSAPRNIKVAPKVKTAYIRFDSRRLMNPISLPSIHPAAQPRSSIGPLPLKSPNEDFTNDLFEVGKNDKHHRQDAFPDSAYRTSSFFGPSRGLNTPSLDLESAGGSTSTLASSSATLSPVLKPSTVLFVNAKFRSGPDSLGGFNYVESRQNTRRAKRNAIEKKRQERDFLIADFKLKLSGEDIMGAFDALFKLSFNRAQDWIKSNLSSSLETVSNPLRFTLKLVEFWTMRFGQRHSPSHERALFWLLNPLGSILLQFCEQHHFSLAEEDAKYMREKVTVLGPSLPPKVWANLINLLELPVSEELLLQRTRELLSNIGKLEEAYFFVKELSLQALLPFDELFVPFIRTKHFSWASELAFGNPILLHQLVMAIFPIDALQSLRIVLDCSMDVDGYSSIEVAAKLPELNAIMHQGLLLEFVELICGRNAALQVEISKSALLSGHVSEFRELCSLFQLTVHDLDIDENFEIPESCSICQESELETICIDNKFLELSVPFIFDPSDCDLEFILLSSSLVAFNLEYRPKFCQFCRADSQRAATLQLATHSCCVVLDLMAPLRKYRLEILISMFENPDILKLGFGIENDLRMLSTTLIYPNFNTVCSVLDLQKVVAKLSHIESAKQTGEIGLSQACEFVLGTQLDKSEQISNWEHRPLRKSQIIFAAIDAYCLILLSEKFFDSCLISESFDTSTDDSISTQDDFSILLAMTANLIDISKL